MKVDMESQGYWYDDVQFKKDDTLLTVDGMRAYLDDSQKAAQLAALGCLVMNIVYQGDEAKDFDLMLSGDPRSDRVKLYKCTGDYKEVLGRKLRPNRKEVEQGPAFSMLLDASCMLDVDISDDMGARLTSDEPNLIKCTLAGMCARMDLTALSQMLLIPGMSRLVSVVMQLRQ